MLGDKLSKRANYLTSKRYWLVVLLVALAYVVTAKFGLSFAFTVDQVTTVWPPIAIALITILTLGYRYWPAVAIGALSANLLADAPFLVALGIAIGNTLAPLAGAYFLQKFNVNAKNLLYSMKNVVAFIFIAALGSTLISSTLGSLTLAYGGLVEWGKFVETWQIWWVGDIMGVLIFVPFILILITRQTWETFWERVLEATVLLALVFMMSVLIFTYGREGFLPVRPVPYMITPLLILVSIRLLQPGIFTAIVIVLLTAVWGTISGLGPFVNATTLEANLIALQLFLFIVTVTALLGTVVLSERNVTNKRLQLQAIELEETKASLLRELQRKEKLEVRLKEANERATNILSGILDEDASRRSKLK